MLAGATLLHSHVEIEQPDVRPSNKHWLSMKATVFASTQIRCIFHYFRNDISSIVTAGHYIVSAMVCIFSKL